jgi:catechol 2,3-dioxygenase-like lactoylglutathione lyase family enzyme
MPLGVHHVNISVPTDGAAAEGKWLVEMLGYRQVESGPELAELVAERGSEIWWFEADDGSQVHLSRNAEHTVVAVTHTAVRLGDEYEGSVARLTDAGADIRTIAAIDGEPRAFVHDPAGNLWELYR